VRVNLGSGLLPLPGYVNVDAHEDADIKGDFRKLNLKDVDEALMSHALEHISHTETIEVLERIRSWLNPGGKITVEVPDMKAIMANPGPNWLTDIYGVQSHDGEHHRAGFMAHTLEHSLHRAGFKNVSSKEFVSNHPFRPGMPCIMAVGYA
jgi:predicted SAM-dependent methyltransferase